MSCVLESCKAALFLAGPEKTSIMQSHGGKTMTISYEKISAFEEEMIREEAASSTIKRYTGILREFALYLGKRRFQRRSFWNGGMVWMYALPQPMRLRLPGTAFWPFWVCRA
jgi:hypothetical protein